MKKQCKLMFDNKCDVILTTALKHKIIDHSDGEAGRLW